MFYHGYRCPAVPGLGALATGSVLRRSVSSVTFLVISWVLFSIPGTLFCAPSAADYAVRLSAEAQSNPNRITLSWPADSAASSFAVSRKSRDSTVWASLASLPGAATSYTNTSVSAGVGYEYRVVKTAPVGTSNYLAYGYLYAGIALPTVHSRGKLILLVEQTHAAALALQLSRLQFDLAGDGWTVIRHDVARTSSVPAIKALITADYNADRANVKAVYLFGHVPVPYSGEINPDGHPDHKGAWPADAFYGDMDGTWTDSFVNNSSASDARNRNVPGDGKFDDSELPSAIELQVGRVDFYNLPAFRQGERELLRQYLDKNHHFRHKFTTAARRGLIDDHFGAFNGEAFAANGWRAFAPLVGTTNTVAADWLTTLAPSPPVPASQPFLWAYGCGGGSYTSASGIATTSQLATNDPQVVFTMLFGSYFGDWDSQNNFLRAQIATPSYTLASAWAGRPYWMFHHMSLGEPIGFSTRLTQNNDGALYFANYGTNWVHFALMGDPSLRLHPVAPPSALAAYPDDVTGVGLSWAPSPDSVMGYYIYRAANSAGPFTLLTANPVAGTFFLDLQGTATSVYMVRALKLEQSASGTYYNLSQGVFQSIDASLAAPQITLRNPTNNTVLILPAEVALIASEFDPSGDITSIAFLANGQVLGNDNSPPFKFTWSNPPLGVYTLTAQATCASGLVTNSAPVTFTIDHAGKPRLNITALGAGSNSISGQDILNRTYRIQYQDAPGTNWQPSALPPPAPPASSISSMRPQTPSAFTAQSTPEARAADRWMREDGNLKANSTEAN